MYTDIDLAEQQLTGFTHAKEGYNILELAEGMGLTQEEWQEIKARQRARISSRDSYALDKYLGKSTNWKEKRSVEEIISKHLKVFTTSDGVLFYAEQEAKRHAVETAFIKWFDEEFHQLPFDSRVSSKDVIEWLRSPESAVFRNFVATI